MTEDELAEKIDGLAERIGCSTCKNEEPMAISFRGKNGNYPFAELIVLALDYATNNRVSELMAESTEATKDLPWKE